MVMKTDEIINALGCLEMKGGMNLITEELRVAIIEYLKPPVVVKAAPAKPASPKPVPAKVKGKSPE